MSTTFTEQLEASVEKDATERVHNILYGGKPMAIQGILDTEKPQRKVRSDKGVSKPKAEASSEVIAVKLSVNLAQELATAASLGGYDDIASNLKDQIIAHLQKRIAQLQK